jgi:hypothetical protein
MRFAAMTKIMHVSAPILQLVFVFWALGCSLTLKGRRNREGSLILKQIGKWSAAVLAILFGAIQLAPAERTNPTTEEEVPASVEVRSVLKRACYGCHSNETVWPWYSRIAPASWQIARDVREGRAAVNFSTWNRFGPEEQSEIMLATWEEVAEGEMPPSLYLPLHPEANLSEADRAILREWSRAGQGEMAEAEESDDD